MKSIQANFSPMFRFFNKTTLFTALVFFLSTGIALSQITGQTGDRRTGQTGTQTGIDLPKIPGSFYYIDQIGLSLGINVLPVQDAINVETYILGPGDMIAITLSGSINGSYRGLIINSLGQIVIPNIGLVAVDGLLLAEAQTMISEAISKSFRETETHISLEKPRMIQIHIVGDVPFGGGILIPYQTRLDKAVVRSIFEPRVTIDRETGETIRTLPSLNRSTILHGDYSLRNISISRGGNELSADLASYMFGGDLDSNPPLEHGDVIRIFNKQTHGPQVSVSGAVQSPILLEYRADDSVANLIGMAGGISSDAVPDGIEIVRREQNGTINRIKVTQGDLMTPIQPNDRIVVAFNRDVRKNLSAWVHGEAVSPGNFPIVHGQTSALELLEMAGGLTSDALPKGAYLIRKSPVNNRFDGERFLSAEERFQALVSPMTFSETLTSDAVAPSQNRLLNAAINMERIKRTSDQLIEGLEYLNLESLLNRNEVYIDLTNPEQLSSIPIYGGDELFIPRDEQTVFLLGQVNSPGYYTHNKNADFAYYVQNAGGFSIAADESRVFVIKAGSLAWFRPGETTIETGDIIFVDRMPYDSIVSIRQYEFQKRELRNRNIALILSGVATVASVITAYVAITR